MSQSSFIEDVEKWNAEECRKSFNSAVPKLIKISLEKQDSNSVDVIKLLLNNFTVVCDIRRLEQCVFGKVSRKLLEILALLLKNRLLEILICAVYDSIFEELKQLVHTTEQHVQQMQQQVTALLQDSIGIIEGLDLSIKYVASYSEPVHMEYVHSLLPTTIHVIQAAYLHCRESSTIYSQFLGTISEQLSQLFKKVHSLQMVLISLVDKLVVSKESTEEDKDDLMQVILGLHNIGQVAAALDIKINVTIWKVVSRLAVHYKSVLQDKANYSSVIQSLCTHMISSYDYLHQIVPKQEQGFQEDDKGFTKHLKILGFQMKILIKFVDEFGKDLSRECIKDVYKLLLYIQKYIPPSLKSVHIPKTFTDEIQKHLTNGVETLLTKLLSNRSFIQIVSEAQQSADIQVLYIPRCMTLLNIFDLLHSQPIEIQVQWINPKVYPEDEARLSLFEMILEVTKLCYSELCLNIKVPGIASQGKQQGEVSLYELICIKLCALAATCPKQHFHVVETVLLQQVLQPHTHTAVLATDVWCFLARYGSADLCRDQCVFLTKLLLADGLNPSPQCSHLMCLLRRMLKFLAPEHQVDYIKSFPVACHPALWCVVPLHTFSGQTCQGIVDEIVTSCTKCVKEWMDKKQNTGLETLKLNSCLQCLVNTFTNPFIAEKHLNTHHYNTVLGKSLEILNILVAENVGMLSIMQSVISSLLELLACFVASTMENVHLLKVLQYIQKVLQQPNISQCTFIKLSFLTFLQNIGKKVLKSNSEQAEILHILPKVFIHLLQDSNPVVQYTAIQTFAQFAEETPHESIVPECLSQNQEVQNEVVTYLNQIGRSLAPNPIDPSHLEEQKCLHEKYNETIVEELYLSASWQCQDEVNQPSSKRMKMDGDTFLSDEQLETSLSHIKNNITAIQTLTKDKTIPDWARLEILNCHNMLTKLLK